MAKPPKVTSVKIPSTPLKKGVQSTIVLAEQAVTTGKTALAASRKALAAAKKEADKAGIRSAKSAVNKNVKTLSRAVTLRGDLKRSLKLANSLCPLNVLFSDYRFFVPK